MSVLAVMTPPVINSFPQWTWTLIAENTTAITLNNLTPGFDFYYTMRPTGGTAPTALIRPKKPREAIKMFNNPHVFNNADEFVLEGQAQFDLYVFCFSRDNVITDNGILLVRDGVGNSLPVNPGGGIDVNNQDQTTPSIITKFNKVLNSTTLAAEAARGSRDIVVADATGFIIGRYIILFNPTTERYMWGYATNVVGTTVTLDTPLDSTFPIGTYVDSAITNMNVNGSVTPQVFGLRGTGSPPGVDLAADITRIITSCETDSPVNLTLFGDLPALANGLVLRRRNGDFYNILNVKDNFEIAGIQFDFNVSQALNPAQGIDGFVCRLTFGGQNKIGVVQRLPIGDDLEIIIQDDLTGLVRFEIVAEGHIVDE